MTFIVGQRLFWKALERHWQDVETIEVTKIGRRWISWLQVGGDPRFSRSGRFDKDTGREESHGFSTPGKAYRSREVYERERDADAAWVELKRTLQITKRPAHFDREEVLRIAARMGLRDALVMRLGLGKEKAA